MAHELGHIGWLQFGDEAEANIFISQINTCKGYPTPDGKTQTWALPSCLANGYYPTATTENWYVIIKEEIHDCLTPEQEAAVISDLPTGWITCGTPEPSPSGDTQNYL